MNAVTVSAMRSLEDAAMRNGWTEERLMEAAGESLARSIADRFPVPGTIIAWLGKGHNAGDAFVALRFLRDRFQWNIAIRPAYPPDQWAPLTRLKSHELGQVTVHETAPTHRAAKRPLVLLDALLGIGAKGALREPLLSLATEMNCLRRSGAITAALDLPSGTDPDTGEIHPGSVIADVTFMIGAPKAGLLGETTSDTTGSLEIVPVPSLASGTDGDFQLITPFSLPLGKQPRPFRFHKGNAGRVGILAGSRDYSGAAVLAATGALRGGAGLVTLHVPAEAFDPIAAKCPPEVIVRSISDPAEILSYRYDSLVIGCGLHPADETFRKLIPEVISRTGIPTVVDAEALNLIAASGDFSILRENHILTPHPGEFARLTPDLADLPRKEAVRAFTSRIPSTLLLKGSRTLVARKNHPVRANATGTPGMATGGQGDLLSGVIGALLAIGNQPDIAASAATWLCGRAAERALLDRRLSEQSLLPTDVAAHLGAAFKDWVAG